MKILLFDLETTPDITYVFAHKKYEQDIVKFINYSHTLCFAYKWIGEKTVKVHSLRDYPGYKKDRTNDKALYQTLSGLIEQADIVIAHNGDSFDVKVMNARMMKHGLPPLPPIKTIDTKKVAKKYLKLPSYAMNDLCEYYGLSQKIDTGGFATWEKCMAGDEKAWAHMEKYCKHDVAMLEELYELLLPWIKNFPVIKYKVEREHECPQCHGRNYQKRGGDLNKLRAQCKDCFRWFYLNGRSNDRTKDKHTQVLSK